jgi:hypothetical protein
MKAGIKMSRGKPITQAEARLNLHALNILSGKTTVPLKPRQRKVQHEAQIQKNFFEWARLSSGKYPELKLMFHIPNGGRRDKIEAYHLKLQNKERRAGYLSACGAERCTDYF